MERKITEIKLEDKLGPEDPGYMLSVYITETMDLIGISTRPPL
jgi:hypothetical protein